MVLFFTIFQFIQSSAQEITGTLSAQTLFSTDSDIPFWLSSNQNGLFDKQNASFQIVGFEVERDYKKDSGNKIDYTAGLNTYTILGNKNNFQINQWYAGLKYSFLNVKVGAFANKTVFGGLSSSNGDLHWSNNARPLPRLQLATNGYTPIWILPKWFTINALWEEGLLNDERYVSHTHLHHKYLNGRFRLQPDLFLMVGIDHYVMWGGDHPTLGPLPDNFNAYVRYVLGLPGNDEFIKGDQNLMAGNHLGKYRLRMEKNWEKGNLVVYLDHPFDDRMDLANIKDNMLGIYYAKKGQKGLTKIMYEFMYTEDQRVDKNKVDANGNYIIHGYESFFIHGTYRSGLSYKNRMIATPFSAPVTIVDGVNLGSGNNRIILHHIGIEGYINPQIQLRGLLSYSINYGTYGKVYDQVIPAFFDGGRNQFSAKTELNYYSNKLKMNFYGNLAIDLGEMYNNRVGIILGISKNLF